jgi:hypothetical protein
METRVFAGVSVSRGGSRILPGYFASVPPDGCGDSGYASAVDFGQAVWRVARVAVPVTVAVAVLVPVCWWEATR